MLFYSYDRLSISASQYYNNGPPHKYCKEYRSPYRRKASAA